MPISPKDIIPLTKARAKLTELCEREHIHLTLLEEAIRGVEDVSIGRTMSLKALKTRYGR